MILEARGLFLESRGPSLKISEIIMILGVAPARKSMRKGSPILRHISTFFQLFAVLFFDVFSSVRFFVILGARRLHFGVNFEVILRVPDL